MYKSTGPAIFDTRIWMFLKLIISEVDLAWSNMNIILYLLYFTTIHVISLLNNHDTKLFLLMTVAPSMQQAQTPTSQFDGTYL